MTSEQKEAFLNSWFGASDGRGWTHGMAGSFVDIINAQFDEAISAYTSAAPVSNSLKAKCERHEQALQDIVGLYQPRTPIQRAINIARSALNEEPSND